ncbi:MAG: type II toxin-antitoxin system VapC family toxin [bacterium]|nr:type II toxin-antitoxin system VapC family toxin [bacterium]
MADRRVLVDTSIIIEFLRKTHKDRSLLWKIKTSAECFMSSISLFELLSGVKTPRHREDIHKVTRWIESVYFDDDVADMAASIFRELKQQNQVIEFRDIFIAATARLYNFPIATLNTDHFTRIDGLTLFELTQETTD